MAVVNSGAAVFWGIGSSFTASGTGMGGTGATLNPQSVDFDVKADIDVKIKDYKGESVARVLGDVNESLKLEVIPTADTIAHAKGASILPAPGAVVTIVDTDDTEVAGATTTAWQFIRGSKRRSNTDVVKLMFELERQTGVDIVTPAT